MKTIAELLAGDVDAVATEHRRNFGILCAAYPALAADWKGPIDAKLMTQNLANKMKAAVEFMTGAEAVVTKVSDTEFLLKSVGYRMGPCGDH